MIGVFGACEPAGKWIRAAERRRWRVWSSSEWGIWYTRATKEDGAGGRVVSAGNGVRPTMGKRGGRRREEEEEWKTGKKVH